MTINIGELSRKVDKILVSISSLEVRLKELEDKLTTMYNINKKLYEMFQFGNDGLNEELKITLKNRESEPIEGPLPEISTTYTFGINGLDIIQTNNGTVSMANLYVNTPDVETITQSTTQPLTIRSIMTPKVVEEQPVHRRRKRKLKTE